MTEIVPSEFQHEVDPELADYRSVSIAAVLSLVFGLLAWMAMISPLLWIVPAAGVALAAWALWSIGASDGALIGRNVALAGLALSLLFGTAAPAAAWSESWWLRREARPVAEHWLALLRDDQPHQAHQLTLPPAQREASPGDVWNYYRNSDEAREGLQHFVQEPVVRTLLALGQKAKFRYWGTRGHAQEGDVQHVSQYYAVTYPKDGQPVTFFLELALQRTLDPLSGQAQWRISGYEGGVRPFDWEQRG